jgi:DinB superfamily
MLTETERQNLISHIETLPDRVEALIKPLSDEQLNLAYKTEGWTIRQYIHHLADAHMNGYVRMKLVATEDDPVLKGYDQVAWGEMRDCRAFPIQSSLAILRGLHSRWTDFLKNMPRDSWLRKGNHTEHGEMTLDDLLVSYEKHGETHLDHIKSAIK